MSNNPGISFIIRAKNEQENVRDCLLSIVDIADEIIFVDNQSTDDTSQIASKIAQDHKNIKLFRYDMTIPRCGIEQKDAVARGDENTIAAYYNWCLDKATKNVVIKWDADFIPQRDNLKKMIELHELRTRSDQFALWFTGETMFIDAQGKKYIKKSSKYDEYRIYSKLHGFRWIDETNWEYPSRNYMSNARKERFELPCFYELKRVGKNELEGRTNNRPVEQRDMDDRDILEGLSRGVVDRKLLREFEEVPGMVVKKQNAGNPGKYAIKGRHFVIFHSHIPSVGGIESAIYNLAGQIRSRGWTVTIAYRTLEDARSLFRYAKVANVIKLTKEIPEIECDVCLIASNHRQPIEIKARDYIQWVHSDYSKYNITLIENPGVTKYVAVSQHVARVFKKLYDKDCTVIYNLLDDRFGSDDRPLLKLLTVSRMTGEKGFDRMVVFAKELQKRNIKFQWVVCGDNARARNYEQQIKDNFKDIPEMCFVGFKEDVATFMKEADYLVQLSDFEGCPLVVLEALRTGTPCIVTNWGGVDELVKHGENGYIVPMNLDNIDYKRIVGEIPSVKEVKLSDISEWENLLVSTSK